MLPKSAIHRGFSALGGGGFASQQRAEQPDGSSCTKPKRLDEGAINEQVVADLEMHEGETTGRALVQ